MPAYLKAKKMTSSPCLLQFYYYLINRVIPTRKHLFQQKIEGVLSDKCMYCNDIDTIEHAFFECPDVLKLWCKTQNWLRINCRIVLKLSVHSILFLTEGNETENLIKLIILYYIYVTRINGNPTMLIGAINEVKKVVANDYFKSRQQNNNDWFMKRWQCMSNELSMTELAKEYNAII